MRNHLIDKSSVFVAILFSTGVALGDFTPIVLTSDSYNCDVVIEKSAPSPCVPVTTASMDTGVTNTGFSWFERGHNTDWPAAGLPEAGAILVSDSAADHRYQFAPNYQTNNAVLVDSSCTHGTLLLTEPAPYSGLSLLTSSAGGHSAVVGYTIRFQDGSAETGSFISIDWISGATPAWSANGRISVTAFTYDIMNSDNPRLYTLDINLTNKTSSIISIEFTYISGLGHNAIFALSGQDNSGAEFNPIGVSGYNQDMIVEASAIKPGWLDRYTSATMDNGTANASKSWYESGYYSPAPETGLPPAGATFTNQLAADHAYKMPASYTNDNAILLDATVSRQSVTFVNRARYGALSLLTASGHGPVTNSCIVNHADGTTETNVFVSPDWFDSAPAAFRANGCVSISTKLVTSLNSGFPALFAVDLPLANTNSPVVSLDLAFKAGGHDSHAAIFAISGAADFSAPVTAPRLSIRRNQDGILLISSTAPGRLQSTAELKGPETLWHDEGPVSQNSEITQLPAGAARFFRVLAP